MDQEQLSSLLGHGQKKPSLKTGSSQKPDLSKRFVLWGGWENEFGGIDIGSDSIKFVLLGQDGRRLRLKDVQIEKLTRLGNDAKPEDRDQEILNGLLKIASRAKGKGKVRVGVSLNDPTLYTEWVSVPRGSEVELRESVRKELSEKHLIDPGATFFDFTKSDNGSSSAEQELFVVASPKELVYHQFEMVQGAGFKLLNVETNALASFYALKRAARWERSERILILDVGFRCSNLSIVTDDQLRFNRIIPIAGERFTKEIQNHLGINFDEAERLKMKHGLTGGREGETESQSVSQILFNEVDKLISEVERSFQFAFSKEAGEEGRKIDGMYLIGGGARLKGFRQYLEKRWEAPVREADIWEGLSFDERDIEPDFLSEVRDLSSAAIGLALCITEWKVLPFGLGMPG